MAPPPVDPSDLIFPSAHQSINKSVDLLKKSHLSITNRLHSIAHDASFVQKVAEAYHLPLIANERCGSWYIDTKSKAGSAYFKSTDGHFGEWSFSLRRLNLQVLDVVAENIGCIIVDSTRRGKSMPDALCKTVPIWIAVLNRVLLPDLTEGHPLWTPEDVVSRSEHSQIEKRIPQFVEELQRLDLDLDSLRSKLGGRPIRIEWVTPDTLLPSEAPVYQDWSSIVLCTASGRTTAEKHTSFEYVQGAADDHEAWACRLTPGLFWSNKAMLLSTAEDDLPAKIAAVVSQSATNTNVREPMLIKPTANICIGNNAAVEAHVGDFDVVISCSELPSHSLLEKNDRYIHLKCSEGKVGSRQLRAVLPLLEAVASKLRSHTKVLVTCPSGRDMAVGAALALLCLCCSDDGSIQPVAGAPALSKAVIKQRLSWIMVSMPDAAPSRTTLQSVNAFLLT